MRDIFISLFVLTALSLVFSHAWNLVAESMLDTWEFKTPDGTVKKPVLQTFIYAMSISVLAVTLLFLLHRYGLTGRNKAAVKH